MAERKDSVRRSRKTTKVSPKKTKQLNQDGWTIGELLHGAEIFQFLEWFRRQNIPIPKSSAASNEIVNKWLPEHREQHIAAMIRQIEHMTEKLKGQNASRKS